ncbi:MAG: alpha-amylase family glycosyl hydrolase [Spirochaetales bacterium]
MLFVRLSKVESEIPFHSFPYLFLLQKGLAKKEFHISRASREKYQCSEELFSSRGNVIFTNFAAVRVFARTMNRVREASLYPERSVRAGDLNAMGLIDEILHYVVTLYLRQYGQEIMSQALEKLEKQLSKPNVKKALEQFVNDFPPLGVYQGKKTAEEYLQGTDEGVSNYQTALEELMLLWLANENPAFSPFKDLFDDESLRKETAYLRLIRELEAFFQTTPPFGPDSQPLIEMLQSPIKASPYSLSGQLEYIRTRWGLLLGSFLERLLRGMDFIREETKLRGFGPAPLQVYQYTGAGYEEEEIERFSPDRDWMPCLVLIAKSTLVWLDQLSKKYGRNIRTLDAIPDEELDWLSQRGINGLWLIGIWERSRASRRIKELCGNPDAEASAYALHEYEVAWSLGGWSALEDLKRRAWRRGIRLASDMVPNHTGIDSRWVIEHPEWFIQTHHPPFPSYTFTGENLSHHPDVGIFLEDHYYNRTDAAVVFKRVHWPSGEVRYIYHGNDGTHMPWNDTAQLNFLLPDLREAVIQTILHVARNFSIIRFDAAMTLTKRHYQRLWFPEPGSGGDIPSRAEFGMTKEEFNLHFPTEFWREVVDRAARECPDTLLLAEAFWMMEGYFVRTLGMHRVYNSAFMNMLKAEENAKYRWTIKNTQEFDRNILKRFVNFMNNPDEETAIAQFGEGDKYFGVCTLMVTLPGLPMFGHGQIEGFREKYGMEYKRAYWDEVPNQALIERHEREIFPLLKRRYLFAEVENFLLYDLFQADGKVNENVFAFSNRKNQEAALVLYNNSLSPAAGWIYRSAAYAEKDENGGKVLVQKTIAEGLCIHGEPGWYCIFREQRSNLWFIREGKELYEKGLYVQLRGYESQVFLDFYEVYDGESGKFSRLFQNLGGRGTPSIEQSLRELVYAPLYRRFKALLGEGYPHWKSGVLKDQRRTIQARPGEGTAKIDTAKPWVSRYKEFLQEANRLQGGGELQESFLERAVKFLDKVRESEPFLLGVEANSETISEASPETGTFPPAVIFLWAAVRGLGVLQSNGENGASDVARSLLEEWGLEDLMKKFLQEQGITGEQIPKYILLIKILLTHEQWWKAECTEKDLYLRAARLLQDLLSDPDIAGFCGVNTFEGVTYYHLESFLDFCLWMDLLQQLFQDLTQQREQCRWAYVWQQGIPSSHYRVDSLLSWIVNPT